ncbi:MAG: hypothetical protein PUB18_02180 [bacterium]|nr:hypothetical protein [bacterium]
MQGSEQQNVNNGGFQQPVQPQVQPQQPVQPQQNIYGGNYENQNKKKKKSTIRRVFNVIYYILFTIIVLEAIIGIINMKRLNDGQEPILYINSKKEETTNKVTTSYNLGLYKIIKTDTEKDTRIVLKPFFIKD